MTERKTYLSVTLHTRRSFSEGGSEQTCPDKSGATCGELVESSRTGLFFVIPVQTGIHSQYTNPHNLFSSRRSTRLVKIGTAIFCILIPDPKPLF